MFSLFFSPIQAVTGILSDPLLTQQADRDTEQRIIAGNHGNDVPDTSFTMDAVRWLAVQLMYIDSSVRERSRYVVLSQEKYSEYVQYMQTSCEERP